ncbi:hypothetical protein [Nakamurella endophytica]|uniref:Uncharacterized protein n=1 Tax=Nakamurella endophytica TaxID=1748367 RepID=A0A917WDH7_9ACTN|nr:hypothetical protein [Nakamurella endophytica]GGL95235.1 hypothetical protein GCM10011594_13640 [Nakamurella endophytica]
MPVSSTHALTNLSSGHAFDLPVPVGEDVAAAAKAFLVEQGLPEDVQSGFYVSVYPVGLEETPDTDAGSSQLVANPPSNLDSSPTGSPYDPELSADSGAPISPKA